MRACMIATIAVALLLGVSTLTRGDTPAPAKPNPYMPTAKDLPTDSGTPAAGAKSGEVKGKWIDNSRTTDRKPKSKIPIGFTASCNDAGRTYSPEDPGYNLCLENHRRKVEDDKARANLGRPVVPRDPKASDVAPRVEVKFGDQGK